MQTVSTADAGGGCPTLTRCIATYETAEYRVEPGNKEIRWNINIKIR